MYAVDRVGLALSDSTVWFKGDGVLTIPTVLLEVKDLETFTNAWQSAVRSVQRSPNGPMVVAMT